MTDEDFIREMEARPGEAEPALMFVDYLEESGRPAHAELIRLHHEQPYNNKYAGGFSTAVHTEATIQPETLSKKNWGSQSTITRWFSTSKRPHKIGFQVMLPREHADQLMSALKEEIPPFQPT